MLYYISIFACLSGVILQTFLLRSHEVATLVLSHLDVPLPGGGGDGGVDVEVDGHTGVAGRHPHVLPGVEATDNRRGAKPRNTDYQLKTSRNYKCDKVGIISISSKSILSTCEAISRTLAHKLAFLPVTNIPVGSSNFHGLKINSTKIKKKY